MRGYPSPEQKGRNQNYHHPFQVFAKAEAKKTGQHPLFVICITLDNTGNTPSPGRAGRNYPRGGYRALEEVENPIKQNKPRRARSLNGYYSSLNLEYARSFNTFSIEHHQIKRKWITQGFINYQATHLNIH